MEDIVSAAEFVVEVAKLKFADEGGVELDSVSPGMKTRLDEAADFAEAAAGLDAADNEAAAAAAAAALKKQR